MQSKLQKRNELIVALARALYANLRKNGASHQQAFDEVIEFTIAAALTIDA